MNTFKKNSNSPFRVCIVYNQSELVTLTLSPPSAPAKVAYYFTLSPVVSDQSLQCVLPCHVESDMHIHKNDISISQIPSIIHMAWLMSYQDVITLSFIGNCAARNPHHKVN